MEPSLEAGIVTSDAATLTAFYVGGLGFRVDVVFDFPQGEVHRLSRGQARLKLFQPAHVPEQDARTDTWPDRCGFAYAALRVDDVGDELARAADHGAEVMVEPTEHRPGATYALLSDPEGNVWEILQEPV